MRIITYILLIVVFFLGITFAFLNSEYVVINYYVGKHSLPLSLLLAFVLGIGCLLGLAVSGILALKQKGKIMRLQNRIKLAEKELANLRTIPLKDNH